MHDLFSLLRNINKKYYSYLVVNMKLISKCARIQNISSNKTCPLLYFLKRPQHESFNLYNAMFSHNGWKCKSAVIRMHQVSSRRYQLNRIFAYYCATTLWFRHPLCQLVSILNWCRKRFFITKCHVKSNKVEIGPLKLVLFDVVYIILFVYFISVIICMFYFELIGPLWLPVFRYN